MPIATLTNVRYGFGTHIVLDGATVSIEPGEKVGLVGRNGGGKSTLMKLIAGLWQVDFGTLALVRALVTWRRTQGLSQRTRFAMLPRVRSSTLTVCIARWKKFTS